MNSTMDQGFPPLTAITVMTPDMPLRGLDYLAPASGCRLGDFVLVPLGKRQVPGVVWGPGTSGLPAARLRPVEAVLDLPPMRESLRRFIERAADYTMTPLPAMLRLATRAPGLGDPAPMRRLIRKGAQTPERMTQARVRVLEALSDYGGAGLPAADLCRAAGVGASVLRGMIEQGSLVEGEAPRDLPYPELDAHHPGKPLSPDQQEAAKTLREGLRTGQYGTTLLKGVTGSGKTEVYLEAVAECLALGRQALVLLPEIALTSEFLSRVEARFGARPGEWHSGVSPAERRRLWTMCATGGVGMVVGARSALFLPFQDLGLIVIDEEHDTSYKQEDGVLYNARDMAVLRAALSQARVVLASATPSLETWANADAGRYQRLDLHARFGTAELPDMRAIDMREAGLKGDHWISPALQQAVEGRLRAGEQSLLFLNRRGYAPVTICRACGHQIGCSDCDARMVEHRFLKRLVCHQCGASRPIPNACPNCNVEGKLAPVGPGVERLEEEAKALWPEARVRILSSDQFGTARELKDQIDAIARGEADVIVGTQIVAKGHNFPHLTLVGVIDADLGLQGSDLRAAERTFQLMRQVAGRAGRSTRPGLALLQTHQPEHPVIRAILSGNEEGFWQAEANARAHAHMPPYTRLAGIILSSTDAQTPFDFGAELVRRDGPLRQIGAEVWGPAAAPIARVRGRYRVRLLVRAGKAAALQAALGDWIGQLKPPKDLRIAIDIDPQTFF